MHGTVEVSLSLYIYKNKSHIEPALSAILLWMRLICIFFFFFHMPLTRKSLMSPYSTHHLFV
jgi:hypothetical protein